MFNPTHVLTVALPGYPHPEARADLLAVKVRRDIYRTQDGTVYIASQVLAVREVA
jgi:hypothetical protein